MKRKTIRTLNSLLVATLILSALLVACAPKPPKLKPVTPNPDNALIQSSYNPTQIAQHATPTPKPSATPWPVASNTPSPTPGENRLGTLNPLTGLRVEQPELLRQRPILVKIANWPEGLRPADGLNKADMVFEYYIGAQSNHLLALYYGTDHDHVGPLGPGRVIDARLTEHQQGQLIVASGDAYVEDVLTQFLGDRNLMRGYAPCPGICTETVAQGGNTFVNTGAIRELLADDESPEFTPSLFGLTFSDTPPKANNHADRFSYLYADFSVMDWRYNPEKRQYELWQDKKLSTGRYTLDKSADLGTNDPIAFDNIIFLYTRYVDYRKIFWDINFDDGNTDQRGILLRDGNLYHIRWAAKKYDEPLLFFDLQGEPIALKPGRTWITLGNLENRIEQVDEREWDMHFIIK